MTCSKEESRGSENSVCIAEGLYVGRRALAVLQAVDNELAMLALLTLVGVKPMSRWEKALGPEEVEVLRGVGLYVSRVRRTALNGAILTETLFGRTPAYVDVYGRRWEGQALDKSAETVRFEGFLFGYPPCCVEAYIRHPYAANDLDPAVQGGLFHWACKGCVITPLLVPVYQRLAGILDVRGAG